MPAMVPCVADRGHGPLLQVGVYVRLCFETL